MTLLMPPHPGSDAAIDGLTGGYVVTDSLSAFSEFTEQEYILPISNPFVAVAAAAAVALGLHVATRHARSGPREVLALSAGIGVGAVVPSVWQSGAPLFDCVPDWQAAALLVAFSAFGAASRYALASRWWAAVVFVPALLGLIRFGVECPTGLGVVAAGPVLGLVATGVLAGRAVRPTGA
ncbi:hypothetical protein ACFPM7_13125 [Actinokineospora guangxiensis]|uniref:DUF998 domain-containing protein n=1 Tax=Actinokineospora guangxiensis TaxID=1490288 RepID=A0ABW0EMJ4_9PSEU